MTKMPLCCPGPARAEDANGNCLSQAEHSAISKSNREIVTRAVSYQGERFGCDHKVLKPSDHYVNPLETNSAETSHFSKVQPSKCRRTHTVLPEAINGPQRAQSQVTSCSHTSPITFLFPSHAPPWMSLQTQMRSVWLQRHPRRATRISEFSLCFELSRCSFSIQPWSEVSRKRTGSSLPADPHPLPRCEPARSWWRA